MGRKRPFREFLQYFTGYFFDQLTRRGNRVPTRFPFCYALTMIPESQETEPEAYSSLLAVATGGAVVFLALSWFGLTTYSAFAAVVVYLVVAVPLVLWLRSRRPKTRMSVRSEDET